MSVAYEIHNMLFFLRVIFYSNYDCFFYLYVSEFVCTQVRAFEYNVVFKDYLCSQYMMEWHKLMLEVIKLACAAYLYPYSIHIMYILIKICSCSAFFCS